MTFQLQVEQPGSPSKAPIPEAPFPESPRHDAAAPGGDAERVVAEPIAPELGRLAGSPTEIPWLGWKAVIRRTLIEMLTDRVSLAAAGVAFYATLALFPAISMLISVYGLWFDPVTVEPQLEALRGLLPPSAYDLITERVHQLVSKPRDSLGFSLLVSSALTLWSSATGVKSMLGALNLAYEEKETRNFLTFQLLAFTMTICTILGGVVCLAILVGLPATLNALGLSGHQSTLIRLASLGLLIVFVTFALSLLYRYGPARRVAKKRWVTPGSMVATLLWMLASVLFSFYVSRFATYDATYGSLGTVVGMMMWIYVSAYAVLLGAELNAELELQTARDSTEGPARPMGARGAYVADHVAED